MDNAAHIRTIAARRFAEIGFDGTSLQAIAGEVGISKPSLLYHYPSKEALREAVLDELFEHWHQTLPQLLDAVTSGERRFEALTEELLRFFSSKPNRARLIVRELLDRPEAARRRVVGTLKTWVTLIAEYIRKGKRSGELHGDVDGEAYVLHVVTSVVTAVAAAPVLSGALDVESKQAERRLFDELLRIVRTGLFRGPGETFDTPQEH